MATTSGYTRIQIYLHWLIAAMILALMVVQGDLDTVRRAVDLGLPYRDFGANLHIYMGNTVLVLVAIRLLFRFFSGVPDAPESSSALFVKVGIWAHWGLYALMILVPLSGIIGWYGRVNWVIETHEVIFNLLLLLTLAHVAAAFFHHYLLRDGLLTRMYRAR